jgi:hypothetical protein
MPRYEVQTYTLCDGWVNTWTVDDEPMTFDTPEAAEAEIDDFLADVTEAVEDGYMADGHDRADYRIVPIPESQLEGE